MCISLFFFIALDTGPGVDCEGWANPWCRLNVLLASTLETGERHIKRMVRVLRREGGLCERKGVTIQESRLRSQAES